MDKPAPERLGTILDFIEARDDGVAVASAGPYAICTLLRTDNHASTSSFIFFQAGCSSGHPTNSVKALKARSITSENHRTDCSSGNGDVVINLSESGITFLGLF